MQRHHDFYIRLTLGDQPVNPPDSLNVALARRREVMGLVKPFVVAPRQEIS